MNILKGVIKKSAIVILPLMAISAFIDWKQAPSGIMAGWLIGIINLRMVSKNVMTLLGWERATVKVVLLNMTRLIGVFSVIALLVYLKVISVIGFVVGFTVVVMCIIIQGLEIGRSEDG